MGREKRLASVDRPLVPEGEDSGLVATFAVGPSGVGPVMGFGSDDFFPVAPVADAETNHSSVRTPEVGNADESRAADQPKDVVTSRVDGSIRGANARSGS